MRCRRLQSTRNGQHCQVAAHRARLATRQAEADSILEKPSIQAGHFQHLLGVYRAHQGERHVAAATQSHARLVQVGEAECALQLGLGLSWHWHCRLIWSSMLVQLLLLSIFLTLLLWLKFYSYPILNTISNDLSITDVAFPGVTICSPKTVNKERVHRYVRTL